MGYIFLGTMGMGTGQSQICVVVFRGRPNSWDDKRCPNYYTDTQLITIQTANYYTDTQLVYRHPTTIQKCNCKNEYNWLAGLAGWLNIGSGCIKIGSGCIKIGSED